MTTYSLLKPESLHISIKESWTEEEETSHGVIAGYCQESTFSEFLLRPGETYAYEVLVPGDNNIVLEYKVYFTPVIICPFCAFSNSFVRIVSWLIYTTEFLVFDWNTLTTGIFSKPLRCGGCNNLVP